MSRAIALMLLVITAGCLPPDSKPVPVKDRMYKDAETMFLMGKYSRAHAILENVVRTDPFPSAFLLKGKCSLLLKEYSRAVDEFKEASERADVLEYYIQAQLGLADAYYSRKNAYDLCIELYRDLLDEYGDRIPRPIVMVRYAHSLIRTEKRRQGRAILNDVIRLYPGSQENSMARDLLGESTGDFYIQLGLFSDRRNAELQKERAARRGLRARVEQEGASYRVIVGYFSSLSSAQKRLSECQQSGFPKAFIKP
jgi:outer membrane protein assembly factor BamD (BamD/ComL family)